MPKAPHELLIELRDVFVDNFTLEELNEFAFYLGVNVENLQATTLAGRARELPGYLDRHGILTKLAEVGPKRRDDIDWIGILGKYGFTLPISSAVVVSDPNGTMKPSDLQKLVPILSVYSSFQTPANRQSFLDIMELGRVVNVNLASGSSRDIALELLLQLNRRGVLPQGDSAIGRLCSYLVKDETLPSSDRDVISALMTQYGLA